MTQIQDYSQEEQAIVQNSIAHRWKKETVEIQIADVEVQIDSKNSDLTECPALFWLVNGCSFIIIKFGAANFKCNFFYKELEQMGTGVEEYKDLQECVTALLQTQADYDSVRTGAFSEEHSPKNLKY